MYVTNCSVTPPNPSCCSHTAAMCPKCALTALSGNALTANEDDYDRTPGLPTLSLMDDLEPQSPPQPQKRAVTVNRSVVDEEGEIPVVCSFTRPF